MADRFSERYGYKPARKVLQVDGVDDALRNQLWNVLYQYFLDDDRSPGFTRGYGATKQWLRRLWHEHLKLPFDTIPSSPAWVTADLRKRFCSCKWFEVYDFVEFCVRSVNETRRRGLTAALNAVLERELAGYRVVGTEVAPIIAPAEIEAIEEAQAQSGRWAPAAQHINRALELLAQKPIPDVRNSIKESISAVESVCKVMTGKPEATLGECLRQLETTVPLHGALRDALLKLYGYTSDEQGIRHALLDEPKVTLADAQFMLVTCSAFVNYLISLDEAGTSPGSSR